MQGKVLTAGTANDGLVIVAKLATPAPTPTLVAACINQSGFPYVAGPVAPGEILSIYGAGYGPQMGVSAEIAGGRIGTQLGGVQVLMNGTPAPLLYVSASQINLVAPFEISGSTTATVKIVTTTSASQQVDVPVVPAAPEIFLGSSGSAAILNQDLTVNGPENPAHANDIVAMFVSGAGAMTPAASDGDIPLTAKRKPILPVKVQVQTDTVVNTDAQLTYAGEAPTLVSGAVQINFRVPASNDNLILLTIGDEGPIEAGIYVQ